MDAQALGRYLRESREAKELTLEEAERTLRIRRRILESFELGEFTVAESSPVQIRGFIRNYARYLGLDEDRVLQYYESALAESQRPRRRKKRDTQTAQLVAPRKITDTNPTLPPVIVPGEPRRKRRSLLNTFLMVVVTVASLSVIVFVVVQLVGPSAVETPNAPAPDILGQLPASPTSTPGSDPNLLQLPAQDGRSPTSVASGLTQNYSGQGVMVTLQTKERTWLQVTVDGVANYSGIAVPGQILPDFTGRDNVTLTASNAEALNIIYNGQPQPPFGLRGQKVEVVFRTTGMNVSAGSDFEPTNEFTPTPLPTSNVDVGATIAAMTPSPTPGPSPTPTLTPSITPTSSITPTPSDTPPPSNTPTNTPTASNTPPPTRTPTVTPTPSITPTPSPTAILPPRITPTGLTPTKEGA
jgi:hypothetical protein